MKRVLAGILAVVMLLSLCACAEKEDVFDGSYYSEPTYSGEASDTTSQTDDEDVSSTESPAVKPNDTVNSKPIVDNSSKVTISDDTSKNETPKEEPEAAINFEPKLWTKFGTEETYISYSNIVFYKGVQYAITGGKNNGADCFAIVTVGDNDEYLNCIAILDTANNERGIFNIYNDRIYYLQHPNYQKPDYVQMKSLTICSMNLSGKDKKVENIVDISFTNSDMVTSYIDSKYILFRVDDLFVGIEGHDKMYRYNMETGEFVGLNFKLGSHRQVLSVGEKVFVYCSDDNTFREYDSNFNNEKLFFTANGYAWSGTAENGFIFTEKATNDKYLLDFSGNLTKQ